MDVEELQKRLASEGVYTGPVTGYFGPLTENAVKLFQGKYGIEVLGLVGPKTRGKFNDGLFVATANPLTPHVQYNTRRKSIPIHVHSSNNSFRYSTMCTCNKYPVDTGDV